MTYPITLLDGKKVAEETKDDLHREIKKMYRRPNMTIILVGNNPASLSYVKSKISVCQEVGVDCHLYKHPEDVTQERLEKSLQELNEDPKVDGYIVQLPLPDHIDKDRIISLIDPEKDIDGFTPINIGKMTLNQPTILPATPYGIVKMLHHYNIPLEGKNCVVIGRSDIVGLPISIMLGHDDQCTVTSCHINTQNLSKLTKEADIIIVSVGIPNFLTSDMISDDAIVIDVGINKVSDSSRQRGYRIVGDVDFDDVAPKASYITPVPGGVGPMTIISLIENLIQVSKSKQKSE